MPTSGCNVSGPCRSALLCALIALLVLGLFGGAILNGFTSWDDNHYVTQNPMVTDPDAAAVGRLFTSFQFCNYHPLTILSFMVEHALVGLSPWLYHLDNVLLHAVAAVLAFLLARRLLEDDLGAFLAAVLFAVHPLKVESVAWIAERKGLLCAVFYLGSLFAYLESLDQASPSRARWLRVVSLAAFLGALLSKVLAITLPGALVVLLAVRRKLEPRRLAVLLPFAALSVVFTLVGVVAQQADGAIQGLHGGGLLAHGLSIVKAIGFYTLKVLVPTRLSPRYMLEPALGPFEPLVLLGCLSVLFLATALVWGWRRDRVVFAGVALALVTWAPVSGVVASSTLVADRYLYLPLLGLALAAARLRAWPAARRVAPLSLGILALWFAAFTPGRVEVWKNSLTLWSDALREDPRNPFAQNQLSVVHLERASYAEAAASAIEAARHGFARPGYLFNLCMAYRGLGDGGRELSTAQTILEGDPEFLPARFVVLRHLARQGKLPECDQLLAEIAAKFPGDAGVAAARGFIEEARGNLEAALGAYLQSISLRGGDPETLLSAAVLLARMGDLERALRTAESTSHLQGAFSPGARERLDELVARVDEAGVPAAGAAAREIRGRVTGGS